jgi:hypothetical protein
VSQISESVPTTSIRRTAFGRPHPAGTLAMALVIAFVLGAGVGMIIPRPAAELGPMPAQGAADGWEPVIRAQAAARQEAAEAAARLESAQGLQDGWESVVRAQGVARLRGAQALQDGWESVVRAQGVARLRGAQALQDAWEIALFR